MPIKNILLVFLLFAFPLCAQTIRPSHWIDQDLRYCWNRNQLWELSPLQRPYTAHDILTAMDSLSGAEFEPGMKLMQKMPSSASPETMLTWATLENSYQDVPNHEKLHLVQRATIGAQIHRKLHIYTTFYFDNQLDADSTYSGISQSGLGAYMEQAYLLFEHKNFHAKFGRDFLVWGPGVDATLHLSDVSRPIDHLYLSWANRWINFSFFTGSLDRTEYPIKNEPSVQNRYLSGHRFEIRPWRFLRIGASETALFGGPNVGNDFALINPVLLYSGVQANGPQTANVLGSLDAVFMPIKNLSMYGSFLLDDIQIENKTQDDRGEPAEIGFMAGLNVADPFSFKGFDVFAEYTRVTNRTYNGQGGMWEKYLHRNMPLGHFLGNDFDRLLAGFRYRARPTLRFNFTYESRRRGEGRIHDPFTTPWRDVPDGQTYSEPFPTGVVESGTNLRFTARWQPRLWLYGYVYLSHWQLDNVENQPTINDEFWEIRFNLSIELLSSFSIQ